MDLMLSPEEEQVVDAARSLLTRELPVEFVRWEGGAQATPDRALMPQFAELGWIALGLPEDKGGFGFGATEEALLFREAGRALVTPRLFAAVVAARIAAMAGETARAQRIVSGELPVGIAVTNGAGRAYLIDADGAGEIVLVDGSKPVLLSAADFAQRSNLRSTDETVVLEAASVDGGATAVAGDALAGDHLSLLVAAQLCGSAEAVRDLTVAHAGERAQFGQKIGTFQAVSHPIADMAVRCEAALSQLKVAAIAFRDGRADAGFQVTAARIVAVDAALSNAQAAVQLHGGMGFTAEYPVHFHLKRAHLLDQVGGVIAAQLDRCFAEAA